MGVSDTTKGKSSWWVDLLKVGGAGATIALIALLVVVLDGPRAEVQPAQADIWDVFLSQSNKHENFMRALQKEGMSAPREYDYNGNRVYFSHATTSESPREVLERFQRAFVREGVNKIEHHTVREPVAVEDTHDGETFMQAMAGADELFSGGLIPVENTRNYMAMVGAETKKGAADWKEAIVEMQGGAKTPEDTVRALRYVDAFREEGSLNTTITAVWSDQALDLSKFRNHAPGSVHPFEYKVPVCTGCTRVSRISGTEEEAGIHAILYRSPNSINATLGFYEREMARYGWELEPVMRGLAAMQRERSAPYEVSQVRSYSREGYTLTLIVYRDSYDGQTYVSMQSAR
ncbi:hypothetical protein FRC98_09890 [Lujinxingia vulgaris]|uniref:Uncharacterized protein n=1 Tax=Lujinxingia vulgaris TaxID=2600176 RepID=A0A5C6XCN4_9DELT|nr:hypothetical protein [Lujinxingia vulgaris]TXD37041.1 hypothetical protein FRC98_09890 [Lujinxingia vulgaris]